MTSLLLYNGFTPVRRSPADVFPDNGIGMLRAALEQSEIQFEIIDRTSLDQLGEFNLPHISKPLRTLFENQIFGTSPISEYEKKEAKRLYSEMRVEQNRQMKYHLHEISDHVASSQIPVVGIKLWAGSSFEYCLELCNLIHTKSPETIVAVGGPQVNCFSFQGQILQLTPFDVAVYSEGENALVQLVRTCLDHPTKHERLRAICAAEIPNTICRDLNRIVVNPVQNTNINHKKMPLYSNMSGLVPVHTIVDALGCDYGKCSFCIHPQIYTGFRKRSPEHIVDEMEYMIRQGIGLFSFTASDTPLSHGVKISDEILRRNLKLEFTMLTRACRNACNNIDKITAQFQTLIRAGLKSVFFGVESGCDVVLRHVMNKGVTSDDIAVTMKCLRDASICERSPVNIIASFIFPVPLPDTLIQMGITQNSILEENLELLRRTRPDSFHAAPGLLYAGTDWYVNKRNYNIDFDQEAFSAEWISQELSYHGFIALKDSTLYSFNGVPFQQLIPPAMEFARKGNALGIPSDLWEEQFIFARSAKIEGADKLQELSKELFLDLLTCNDENTRYLYEAAIRRSRELAQSNFVDGNVVVSDNPICCQ